MNTLTGRVAIVTGGGRGIGREHALRFASEGAKVVVNDLGGSAAGDGSDPTPAHNVVAEIVDAGGEAIVSNHDVTSWDGAREMVESAVEAFGGLHVLVNNAGILRDRTIANMSEAEWDAVISVHLKGHFAPLKWATVYWRELSKAGGTVQASVINTVARTRLTGGAAETSDDAGFDPLDPANISPFVAYLATESCPINGRMFILHGGAVHLMQPWAVIDTIEADGRWTVQELQQSAQRLADTPFELNDPWGL